MTTSRNSSATQHYIDSTFAPEDNVLKQVRAKGEELRPGMQISAGEGKLLYTLAKMIGAKRVLEVGCFMGYSAINLARALPEGGELITLEYSDEYADIAQSHFNLAPELPITLKRGAGLDTIPTLDGPFDVVFIDADKGNYFNYLQATLPLLRKGGLMMGDNTLLFGAMAGEQETANVTTKAKKAMTQFNQALADSHELEGVLIPTHEGMTVAIKK